MDYILILVDSTYWDSVIIAPQFILGINNELIPVYIGTDLTDLFEHDTVGIYVKEIDYDKIDHSKEYIFFNNPDATYDDLQEEIEEMKKEIGRVTDKKSLTRGYTIITDTEFEIEEDTENDNDNSTQKLNLKIV